MEVLGGDGGGGWIWGFGVGGSVCGLDSDAVFVGYSIGYVLEFLVAV